MRFFTNITVYFQIRVSYSHSLQTQINGRLVPGAEKMYTIDRTYCIWAAQKKQLHLIILLFHLIILISAISLASGQLDLWAHECSDSYGNYTSNSTYKSNLDKLLTNISTTNNIPYGFYSPSSGVEPDQVNAIALCRGDVVNVSVCQSCLNFLKSNLTNLCPTQMEAIGWAEKCMLRYSTRSILGGVWSNRPLYDLDSGVDAEGDMYHFGKVAQDLIMSLPNKTADGDSRLKFATGEANLNGSHKVYGLMQCTPDLIPSDCLGCLYWGMYYVLHSDKWKTGMRILLPSCSIRYDLQKFYVSPPPPQPATPPSSAKSEEENGVKRKSVTLIVVGVLVCLFLFVIFLVWFCLRRRRRTNPNVKDAISFEPLQKDCSDIRVATNDFSKDNELGSGGFGVVYKGILNGKEIAVKRLEKSSKSSVKEFKNEVEIAAKIQHTNLAELIGYCIEGEEKLLIFEFVSNGSLDKILFVEERRVQLDWQTRFNIIEGVARGLLYLHEDSRYKIVHRDLKPANILLDEDFRPKITDFGTARLFPPDVTHAKTERAAGTRGYMAPEYFRQGLFSVKSDVYSFGVLVLEIVAGRRNIISTPREPSEILINLAWKNWSNNTIPNIVDPKIASPGSLSQVTRCIHIAFLCLQESPESRPTISSVNKMFASHSSDLPYPSQLAFAQNGSNLPPDADALLKCNSVLSLGSSTDLYPR